MLATKLKFEHVFQKDFDRQVIVSTSWDANRPEDDDHIPLYVLWNVPGMQALCIGEQRLFDEATFNIRLCL